MKKKNNLKMGRRPKYTFPQKEIQMVNEKMLNTTNY